MPSFATDSTLDYRIKRGLITDCLKTLCLNMKRKNAYKVERRNRMTDRLMQKPGRPILSKLKREETMKGGTESMTSDN